MSSAAASAEKKKCRSAVERSLGSQFRASGCISEGIRVECLTQGSNRMSLLGCTPHKWLLVELTGLVSITVALRVQGIITLHYITLHTNTFSQELEWTGATTGWVLRVHGQGTETDEKNN